VGRSCDDGTASEDREISVRTFGTFELAFDGFPVERWKAGKARALLQFLLLRPGYAVPRDVLYEALWPDAHWSKDSSSLKVAAHMLRMVLEGKQAPAGRAKLRLVTQGAGYLLEAENVSVDFARFIRRVDAAHAAQTSDDRDRAASLYQQAAWIYQGDFLADVSYDWAVTQREWLRSRLLMALSYLTETSIVRGDVVGVIRWCRLMLDVEPFHEEVYRALMLVHAHLGQLAQVRRWYEHCVSRLREHLQATPDVTTQRLYARAVRGDFTGRRIDVQAWRRELQPAGFASLLRTSA
jgi:DNA-binding SARP family transcriptional activator